MADEDALAAQSHRSGGGTVGGEGAEVAAHGGVGTEHSLAAQLQSAARLAGGCGAEEVSFGQVSGEFHFVLIVGSQAVLGAFHDGFAPVGHGSQTVDAAHLHGDVKALEVEEDVFHAQMPSFL